MIPGIRRVSLDRPREAEAELFRAVGVLRPGQVLKVEAPFVPDVEALLRRLEQCGHQVRTEQSRGTDWRLEIVAAGSPPVVDLRDLEPCGPLERVLEATVTLTGDAVYLARLPRYPRLLFSHLQQRGVSWEVHEEPDGSTLLRTWRDSSG